MSNKLISFDFPDTKCVLVFVYYGLLASFTTNNIFLTVDHGVVVGEELSQGLFNVLDSLVVNIEHLVWHLLFIQAIFDCRLTGVLGDVVLLLYDSILTEELDPILE